MVSTLHSEEAARWWLYVSGYLDPLIYVHYSKFLIIRLHSYVDFNHLSHCDV